MATRLVVNTCKKSARSDHLRTVMSAGTFHSPRDALTKFRMEVAENSTERQVLTFNSRPNTFNRRGRFNFTPNINRNFFSNRSSPNSYSGHNQTNFSQRELSNTSRPPNNNRHVRLMNEEQIPSLVTANTSENEESARWPEEEI